MTRQRLSIISSLPGSCASLGHLLAHDKPSVDKIDALFDLESKVAWCEIGGGCQVGDAWWVDGLVRW